MTHQDLDHLFTSARNVPIETSATEIATWVGATAATSAGVLGVAGKLKLFIAKKTTMLFGITLGTVGVTAVSIALMSSPPEQKETSPVITYDFVEEQTPPKIQETSIDFDDTTRLEAPEFPVAPKPVAPVPPIASIVPVFPAVPVQPVMAAPINGRGINGDEASIIPAPRTPRRIVSPPKPCTPNRNHQDCCENNGDDKKRESVTGDGHVTKQVRNIKSFSEINIEGLFDVTISQGEKESVTVETDANLQEFVVVSNDGNTLTVKNGRANFKKVTKMEIHIVLKDVSKISGSGLGDIKTESTLKLNSLELRISGVGDSNFKLDCDRLDIRYGGVGDVKLSGKAKTVKMNCSGVGDVRAYDLEVTDLKLNRSGVGDTKVNVIGELTIDFSGVGTVSYKGAPTTKNITKTGIGSIKAK
ncbi:MAG: hypothetical protein ACJA1C_001711 [Crocinitomicaceae bacterium]|jgi:hypothetical protein